MTRKGNRKHGGKSGDKATEPQKQPEQGRDWFEHTCTNTEAHGLLSKIETILNGGIVDPRIARTIQKRAQELTEQAKWPDCPSFCARTIQVMKRLAFLPDAVQLCDSVFRIIMDAWHAGLQGEDKLKSQSGKQGQGTYNPLLNPQRLLEGWTMDLSLVAKPCLPSYLRLLRFERLHTQNQQLDTALAAFVERIKQLATVKPIAPQDVDIAAKATAVFESEILESLLLVAKEQAISHVAKATQLIATAVQADISVLEKDTGPVRRAMDALPSLICRASVSPTAAERESTIQKHLHEAYLVLNQLHRHKKEARPYLRDPLAQLMPWLGGWEQRPLRKNGKGWKASIQYTYNQQIHEVDGDVVDFCAKHKGVHIKLGSSVKKCSCLPGKPISLEFYSSGETHFVDEAKIILTHPAVDKRWECKARAIRGWMYEEEFDKPSKDAGAAFSIADMRDDLRTYLNQLENRSGLEPLAGHPSGDSDSAVPKPLAPGSRVPFKNGPEGILGATETRSQKPIHISELTGKVSFAIITVRPDEFPAVLGRFPNAIEVEGGKRPYFYASVTAREGYEIGVVIGRCGEQGHGPAQGMASNMIYDFAPPWILLVGIAGGIPDSEFSLGDVLLSSRVYDFSASAALPNGTKELNLRGGPMHKDVRDLLEKIPAFAEKEELRDWADSAHIGIPKPSFRPKKDFAKNRFFGSESWQGRARKSILRHFPGGVSARDPVFWPASTTSGNVMLKDPALAQILKQSVRSFCATEMELGGVYEAVLSEGEHKYRVLAIRGLSDIVGFDRDADWTLYACHSAASFAHRLIVSGLVPKATLLPNPM
ncbi:MAG: hypothetical protein NTZ17_00250 [Phycisphaerae bacterium]|nr:hypothetical protein [Phycisphaerae bacterium]